MIGPQLRKLLTITAVALMVVGVVAAVVYGIEYSISGDRHIDSLFAVNAAERSLKAIAIGGILLALLRIEARMGRGE